jgi:transcriptional regulator with XRE-family HTH domain
LRRARGQTQEQLAERSGLSADSIRRLEHGTFSPSLTTILKLCSGLSLRVSTLFEAFELGDMDGLEVRALADLVRSRSQCEVTIIGAVIVGFDRIPPRA